MSKFEKTFYSEKYPNLVVTTTKGSVQFVDGVAVVNDKDQAEEVEQVNWVSDKKPKEEKTKAATDSAVTDDTSQVDDDDAAEREIKEEKALRKTVSQLRPEPTAVVDQEIEDDPDEADAPVKKEKTAAQKKAAKAKKDAAAEKKAEADKPDDTTWYNTKI